MTTSEPLRSGTESTERTSVGGLPVRRATKLARKTMNKVGELLARLLLTEMEREVRINHENFFMGQMIGIYDIESGEIARLCGEAAGNGLSVKNKSHIQKEQCILMFVGLDSQICVQR
jgi:hypothetical protein